MAAGKRETLTATRVSWPDAKTAELLTAARRYRPIPVYKEVPPKDWQDDSRDRWAPQRGDRCWVSNGAVVTVYAAASRRC